MTIDIKFKYSYDAFFVSTILNKIFSCNEDSNALKLFANGVAIDCRLLIVATIIKGNWSAMANWIEANKAGL